MRIIIIKNISSEEKIWIKSFTPGEEYQIPTDSPGLAQKYATNDSLIAAISIGDAQIGNGETFFITVADQLNWLRDDSTTTTLNPFAVPTYRTKRDATESLVEIAANSSSHIDYRLNEEKYVQGGEIVYTNAEIGDYVSAEIYDKDSVIPEAYRASLCEAWPCVAKYVIKHFVHPNKNIMVIDTYPLNAKITAGLYLRITYYACNSGNTRTAGVNYYMTKKL